MNETRVLIAENDEALRQKLYRALLDVDLFADCASDAAEALGYLGSRDYGIVLLDLGLAGGSDAVLAALQLKAPGQRPIILAIADAPAPHSVDAELVQVIVRRPLRARELAEMMRACADASARGSHRKDRRDDGLRVH